MEKRLLFSVAVLVGAIIVIVPTPSQGLFEGLFPETTQPITTHSTTTPAVVTKRILKPGQSTTTFRPDKGKLKSNPIKKKTPPKGRRYNWTRLLENLTYAKENCTVLENTTTIVVKSEDNTLKDAGYVGSETVYAFNNTEGPEPYKPVAYFAPGNAFGKYPCQCYRAFTLLTFDRAIIELESRNNSVIPVESLADLDCTAEPYSQDQTYYIFHKYPSVWRVCRDRLIVECVNSNTTTYTGKTRVIETHSLDSTVTSIIRDDGERPNPFLSTTTPKP